MTNNYKLLSIILLCSVSAFSVANIDLGGIDVAGSTSIENRYFIQDPLFPEQSSSQLSLALSPEISSSFGQRAVLSFKPFVRIDQKDGERTKFDIRELMLSYYLDEFEIHAGVGKVFWGQTESLHLVDIINQTDFVESIDLEEKLGQPMVDIRYYNQFGNFSLYLLPVFREMTFPGVNGRLRGPFVVDNSLVSYESENEDTNLDWAFRWQHSIGNLEIGLGYFDGTSRLPEFAVANAENSDDIVLAPTYNLLTQYSVDALYVLDAWLLKVEALRGETLGESFFATVLGFERTVGNVFESGYDLGVLMEYQYDERNNNPLITGQNDLMFGARLQLNDFASSEVLLAFIQDLDRNDSHAAYIEASTRLSANWRIEVNAYLFASDSVEDPIYQFRQDDNVTINFEYYF